MKKIITSIAMLLVLCSFAFVLAGCSKTLEFTNQNLNTNLNREFVQYMQVVTPIKSTEELENFFEYEQFKNRIITGFESFNDNFFKDKALLIISYLGDSTTTIEISKVTKKNKELFVHIKTNHSTGNNYFTYAYITLDMEDLNKVEKFSYVIKKVNN